MASIKVYNITNYKKNNKENREKQATIGNIEFISSLLENNKKCYHEITKGEDILILHGDVDFKTKKNDDIIINYGNVLVRELNNFYNMNLVIDDFKYTVNNGKVDKKTGEPLSSYHWSIPKISMVKYQQKYLLKKIHNTTYKELEDYGINVLGGEKEKDIDEGIYKSDSLFRLPNQVKEEKENTEHKIINGNMKDFITQYIENSELKEFNEKIEDLVIKKERKNAKKEEFKFIQETVGESDIIKLFIEKCYSTERSTDYNLWINFGICLKNSFNYETALNLFNDFSKISSKYNGYDDVKKTFDNIKLTSRDRELTKKSLYFWAKQDNINEYKNIIQKDKLFDLSKLMTHKKIGNLVFEYAKNQFLWKKNFLNNDTYWTLYYFNGIKWIANAEVNFKNYISNELKSNLEELYVKPFIKNVGKNILNEDEEEALKKIALKNSNTLLKLEDEIFRKKCFEASKDDNECIDEEFNNNPYLLGFNNGVWDLKNNIFRNYEYNDFITYSTGWSLDYDFINNKINIDEKKLKEVNDVIYSIQPEEEERNFYLSILSSCLDGIGYQKFFMFVGNGRNGKGLINDYLMKILGNDYSTNLNQSVLGNKSKTGANPEVAKISKKRFISCQEPEKGTVLNLGLIKELTGGTETIDARFCNSNDTKTYLNGTLIYQCNEKPSFGTQECGDAEYERFEILEFKNTFSDDEKRIGKLNAHGKPILQMNKNLSTDEWRNNHMNEFFYILTQHYNLFKNNNYSFKSTVASREATKSYLATSKIILKWFEDNFYYTEFTKEDAKQGSKPWFIYLDELFEDFKSTDCYQHLDKRIKEKLNEKKFIETFKQEEHYKTNFSIRLEKGKNPVKLFNIMFGYRKIEKKKIEVIQEGEDFIDFFEEDEEIIQEDEEIIEDD